MAEPARWFVAFDEPYVEAESAKEAVEKYAVSGQTDFEIDHRVIAINMDALEGTDRVGHFRIGAEEVEPRD